jgi:GNAT superfamily N-acetyltransferase
MSQGPYEIVRYRPEFKNSVARLHSVQMRGGDAEMSARYLDWKYTTNPYISEPLIYLALHNGEPVAMRGFFGSCWEAGDARIVVPCAGDLVVAPDHQNRGLIALIMKQAFHELQAMGFSHVFSLSAGDVAAMSARALGFKSVARVEMLVRMRRFTLAALIWRLKLVSRRLGSHKVLRRRFRGALASSQALLGESRSEFKRFDKVVASRSLGMGLEAGSELRAEEMADLATRLSRKGAIRQVRDPAYLRWRYASPAREYRFVYSHGSQGIDGYLSLSATRGDPFPAVRIADWEGVSGEVKRQLVDAAIRAGRFRQVAMWKFAAREDDLAILEACGLAPEPVPAGVKGLGISVFVKALGEGQTAKSPLGDIPVFERANWDYRMIYSDFV